jgi:hypothetical protein
VPVLVGRRRLLVLFARAVAQMHQPAASPLHVMLHATRSRRWK